MGNKGLHFTTPMMQLQDPKQTKVLIVTLPEPTPVQEAANLQADLRRAGIEPWGWLINHSLQQAAVSSPLLQLRAERQLPILRRSSSNTPAATPWCRCSPRRRWGPMPCAASACTIESPPRSAAGAA